MALVDGTGEVRFYDKAGVLKDSSSHPTGSQAQDAYRIRRDALLAGRSSDVREETWRFLDEDIFLINAMKESDKGFPKRRDFFEQNGKVALWFSHPIKDEFDERLQDGPFPMLMYSKGSLTHALRVIEYQTSKGKGGIVSPYQRFTLKEEQGKIKTGEDQAHICKTWCLVDVIADIDPPLPLEFFENYTEGTPIIPQAMIMSFGYARKKTSEGNMYQHFHQRGLFFSDETITNYFLSLKTKPFVIISGISGTGKTKIAQCFAEYMCPAEDIEVTELPENNDTEFFMRVNKNLRERGEIFSSRLLAEYFNVPGKGERIDMVAEYADQEEPSRINNMGWTDPTRREQLWLSLRKGAKSWIQDNFELGDIIKFEVLDEGRTRFRIDKVAPSLKKSHVSNRLAFISVRPDWMDNRGLLGFYNLLTGAYQPTELLKIMLRAKDDPDRPYFVILDEMNLAKVEYYFSDFLSCLESRMPGEDGAISQEPVYLHDQEEDLEYVDDTGATYYIPPSIQIPTNLYFTGTVNVDETTYMFSPKVLDRANTIEFNDVDLVGYATNKATGPKGDIRLKEGIDARSQFTGFELPCADHYRALDAGTRDYLVQINAILSEYHLHFGYRVANEIALYLKNAVELTASDNAVAALDLQILQKVLPKFHGSRQKLEEPLLRLFAFCFGETPADGNYLAFLEAHNSEIESARFPRSARKITRMLEVLGDQGFASFVE